MIFYFACFYVSKRDLPFIFFAEEKFDIQGTHFAHEKGRPSRGGTIYIYILLKSWNAKH